MTSSAADRTAIAEIMQNWVLWRDARQWDRFRTLWHPEGRMMATWFQGGFEAFIEVSEDGYARGVRIIHMLGATTAEVEGKRAIAQSKTVISQRAAVEGVICDVNCTGRFYTFLEKRNRRWGIVLLQPIYEKDRLDPVDPTAAPRLDATLLAQFPEGYRHLAYLQAKLGYDVKRDMPGLDGPALDALYAQGERWLSGKKL